VPLGSYFVVAVTVTSNLQQHRSENLKSRKLYVTGIFLKNLCGQPIFTLKFYFNVLFESIRTLFACSRLPRSLCLWVNKYRFRVFILRSVSLSPFNFVASPRFCLIR